MPRLALVLVLGLLVACGGSPTVASDGGAAAPTPTQPALPATVTIGETPFRVEVAETPDQRTKGLSGRPALPAGTGMLFVFQVEGRPAFWMKDMRFPLDLVWIDAHCTVVAITEGALPPRPGQADADLPSYPPPGPVVYVLEINAGEAQRASLRQGDRVAFGGAGAGRYGC